MLRSLVEGAAAVVALVPAGSRWRDSTRCQREPLRRVIEGGGRHRFDKSRRCGEYNMVKAEIRELKRMRKGDRSIGLVYGLTKDVVIAPLTCKRDPAPTPP